MLINEIRRSSGLKNDDGPINDIQIDGESNKVGNRESMMGRKTSFILFIHKIENPQLKGNKLHEPVVDAFLDYKMKTQIYYKTIIVY